MRLRVVLPFIIVVAAPPVEAQGGAAAVRPARRDSGGIVMLQHTGDAPRRAPAWSLGHAPLISAGGIQASPDYDLTQATHVELMPDGRIVTLAPIGSRLLVFAPDGRPERSLGRQGQGPGELMAPAGMSRAGGDTLVVPDGSNRRINWVVPGRGFVADRPLPTFPGIFSLQSHGALRNGALVFGSLGTIRGGVTDSVSRVPASVIVMPTGGQPASIVATIPDLEVQRVATRYRGRPGSQALVLRFGRSARVVAWDTVIATGSGEGYRIDLRDARGRLRSVIRLDVPRRPVTRAMRDSALAAALREFNRPGSERLVDPAESKRVQEITPVADSLPPYGTWFVSPDRTLWVVDGAPSGAAARAATAFGQDGSVLGRLTWSIPAHPVAFGTDRVVMRSLDDDGVVTLAVYRIQRGRR